MNLSDANNLTSIITGGIGACIAIGGLVAKVRPPRIRILRELGNWIAAHLVLMLVISLLLGMAAVLVAALRPFPPPSPSPVAKVATEDASNVTAEGATLNGRLEELKAGHSVKVSFQWGTDQTYGNETEPVEMTKEADFSADLGELTPGTDYHFRAKVVGAQSSYYGDDSQFHTPPRLEVTTNEADNLAPNSCTLHGSLQPGWPSDVVASFEWGTDETYGNQSGACQVTAEGTFQADLSGLDPETTCHFRAKAVSGSTVRYGLDRSFETGEVEAYITTPINGAVVPIDTSVEGYTNGTWSKSWHLYVVLEYGGVWWPQHNEVVTGYSNTSGRYEFAVPASVGVEGDAGKAFLIRAVFVDAAINDVFQSWIQNAAATGYPGIPMSQVYSAGVVKILDSVSVTRK